jgi:hypothetical protein
MSGGGCGLAMAYSRSPLRVSAWFDGPKHVALQSGRGEMHTRVVFLVAARPQPAGAKADQALQLLQLPVRAATHQRTGWAGMSWASLEHTATRPINTPQQTTRASAVVLRHCVTPQPKLHVRVRVPSKHVVLQGDHEDWGGEFARGGLCLVEATKCTHTHTHTHTHTSRRYTTHTHTHTHTHSVPRC